MAQPPEPASAPGPGPTILLVEDEFLIRMMLAETLVDEGFTVVEASTAQQGVTLLEAQPAIALMITDLSLPGGMDGLDLAMHARQHRADVPVIFITGRPDGVDPDQIRPSDLVIAKPYLPSAVAAAVKRILQS